MNREGKTTIPDFAARSLESDCKASALSWFLFSYTSLDSSIALTGGRNFNLAKPENPNQLLIFWSRAAFDSEDADINPSLSDESTLKGSNRGGRIEIAVISGLWKERAERGDQGILFYKESCSLSPSCLELRNFWFWLFISDRCGAHLFSCFGCSVMVRIEDTIFKEG